MLLEVSLMKFILRISNEIKWKVQVVLLDVSIIDDVHSLALQGDKMEGESGFTRNIIDELYSSHIPGEQMEGESAVT